ALSNANGTLTVATPLAGVFADHATAATARAVAGDFNGDGRTDIALTGVAGWNSIPLALSNANGTLNVTVPFATTFADLAGQPAARILTGDFNGDGRTDIALAGVPGWNSIPIASLHPDGTWNQSLPGSAYFATTAADPGAWIVPGDFNNDGNTDIAVTGGSAMNSIVVAVSDGDGTFSTYDPYVGAFATHAATPAAKLVAPRRL
ncbi:FG-GAP repeat domain-containing protein, partial [Rhizocola hellebori]|uniref:FG-GAP repeat domain-containing protein n=1 Tax=Rhizocola hellebori TaxID=1392758 RepID=UPI00194114FF